MGKPVPLRSVETARSDELPAPEPAGVERVLAVASDKARAGTRGAMATILERHGSAPSTPGQKLYLAEDGTCVGTVGGGALEKAIVAALVEMTRATDPRHVVRDIKLGAELGMCCGGWVRALVEPIEGRVSCLIVGGGHVATAVAPLLARVGFAVTVVDARDDWGREGRIDGVSCLVGEFDEVGRDLPRSGACLVMTHDHALDQRAIEWALRQGFAFVGGIGSRAKAQRTRDRLEAKGFREDDRARVRMPLGVSVGARLPDEIAVAVAAEMVAWKRSRATAASR